MTLSKFCRALTFGAVAVLTVPLAAMAAITANTSGAGDNTFQQTTNNPCVIGDQSCKNGGLVYSAFSGTPGGNNGSTYNIFSPSYIAGASTAAPDTIVSSFKIGIDDNIATGNGNEVLQFFKTFDCGNVTNPNYSGSNASGVPAPPAGCVLDSANSFTTVTTIPDNNNGNGFSDMTLSGFTLLAGHFYVFEASVSNDSDGMEEFFLIPSGTAPIPEPASALLLSLALLGVGWGVRKLKVTD